MAALYRETVAADAEAVIVPIGRPYPGRRALVLDLDGHVAPAGGLGELCIGGASVARGYLGRPGLTAERFVPDPWGELGGRLYRSGDLCRQRADGTVEFLGRLDQQVKLRGHRIELGEIEAALRACPGVAEAAATVTGTGELRALAGYATPAVGAALDGAALKRALERVLPGYMVPSVVVVVERLPVMANGKLDRAALPAPEAAERVAVAPRDAAEAALLAVWRAVLKRGDIGVTDNFFELGGDSILSLQIIARLRSAGLALSPRQIFEHPTIEGAARLAAPVAGGVEDGLDEQGPIPLTPIQARFFERHPEGANHWNQSVLLRVRGGLDAVALEAALAALVARHDALRLRFERDGDGWRQRVGPVEAGPLLRVVDGSWAENLEREGGLVQRSLDIASGPLLAAAYFPHEEEGRLLLAIHHLAVDGVSWRVLLEEMREAYEQAASGRAIALPATGTPWSRWAARLGDHAGGPERLWELPWWQGALAGALAGAPETDGLPVAPAWADRRVGASRSVSRRLDRAATERLLRAVPRAWRVRVEEVLLAALARTLARTGGGEGTPSVLVSLEGHGREDVIEGIDLSRTVGWFTTRYPVLLPVEETAGGTLSAVKERLRSVPDKGFGFGLLEHLGDAASRRAVRALPRPRVSFNYLGQFDQSLDGQERFGFAREAAGDAVDPASPLEHALDINALVADGVLSLSWRFSPDVVPVEQADAIADRFSQNLNEIIQTCLAIPLEAEPDADRETASPPLAANEGGVSGPEQAAFDLMRQRFRLEAALADRVGNALVAYVAAPGGALPANILPMNSLATETALFCIHPGFGLAGEYRSLAKALNGIATVYGVQSPLYTEPGWAPGSFDELALDYVARIRRIQPEGPYRIAGWSFGGPVALTMAHHLERQGQRVDVLALIDASSAFDEAEDAEADVLKLQDWLAGSGLHDRLATDERRRFDAALTVIRCHGRLRRGVRLPVLDSVIHQWWTVERLSRPERGRDWSPHSTLEVRTAGIVEATHTSIVHHPLLHRQMRDLLAAAEQA